MLWWNTICYHRFLFSIKYFRKLTDLTFQKYYYRLIFDIIEEKCFGRSIRFIHLLSIYLNEIILTFSKILEWFFLPICNMCQLAHIFNFWTNLSKYKSHLLIFILSQLAFHFIHGIIGLGRSMDVALLPLGWFVMPILWKVGLWSEPMFIYPLTWS